MEWCLLYGMQNQCNSVGPLIFCRLIMLKGEVSVATYITTEQSFVCFTPTNQG